MIRRICMLFLLALAMLTEAMPAAAHPGTPVELPAPLLRRSLPPGAPPVELRAADADGKLALSFVPNRGQTHEDVLFEARSRTGRLFFTRNEVVIVWTRPATPLAADTGDDPASTAPRDEPPGGGETQVLRLQFAGANPAPAVVPADPLPGIVNYFLGNDPAQWRTNLPTSGAVVYRNLYPGIALRYEGDAGRLKGTYSVAPGADPGRIRWWFDGASGAAVDAATGDLVLTLPDGSTLREQSPLAWQEAAGKRVPVAAWYEAGEERIGFGLGHYDPALPLVIDPVFVTDLVSSTYLGGNGNDTGTGVAVDASGNAYVTGYTISANFPTTAGAFATALGGGNDAFVTKLSAAGSALLYSTYLGGTGNDYGDGIALDGGGNAYFTGQTGSTDFPTTAGAFATAYGGGFTDSFVTKLNAGGSALVYSTYLGGSGDDYAQGLALDGSGSAYVTGVTASANFPTTAAAFQSASGGGQDAFLAKFAANTFDAALSATIAPSGWVITPTLTFTGTTTGTPLDAGSLRNGTGPFGAWISATTGVPVQVAWDFGGDGTGKTVSLRLRDAVSVTTGPLVTITVNVDTVAPVAGMTALPAVTSTTAISVSWSGSDATSGLAGFDVQVAVGAGSFADWLTGTSATGGTYSGVDGQTYRFQVRARDVAGNVGGYSSPVTTTIILPTATPTATSTPTAPSTATSTSTPTATSTVTGTASPTATPTTTNTATVTSIPTPSATATAIVSDCRAGGGFPTETTGTAQRGVQGLTDIYLPVVFNCGATLN